MKQTAVHWLKEQIECFGNKHELQMSWATLDELLEQAKEMEKQQIIDAYKEGCFDSILDESTDLSRAEQYYNETFKKD